MKKKALWQFYKFFLNYWFKSRNLFQNESSKHLEENGSLIRDGTPSLAFSGIDDFKDPFKEKVIRTLEDGPTSRQ